MACVGWSPNKIDEDAFPEPMPTINFPPLLALGCEMLDQSVFSKVIDLFVDSGKLLIPDSAEEMAILAIFTKHEWALITYIQMGIVTPEVIFRK